MAGWSSRPNEHEQVEALLSPYLDGRTSEAERALVERHLGSCADCARKFATLKATVAAVRALPQVRAPRSYALPRSMARQPRPSIWLVPVLRAATVLATLLFIIAVGGDVLLLNTTRQAAAPAPARVALESRALPAPTGSLQKSAPPVTPQALDSAAQATPPPALPATPAEPPVEEPLPSGGLGAGGGGQQPGGLAGGSSPPPAAAPAAAPVAPVRPSATQTSEAEPSAGKSAGATPAPTAPLATADARSAAGMRSPTLTAAPTAMAARALEPQAPAANQRGEGIPQALRAVMNPVRVAEGALALLALALGVAAWMVDRRSR